MFPIKKIQSLINSKVQVEMKGTSVVLEGTLESADDYMNLHLIDTAEVEGGERVRTLGSVVLRGNNITLVIPVSV